VSPYRLKLHQELELIRREAESEVAEQCGEALAMLDRAPSDYLRWPYPELDALTGGIAPGDVWFVCAFSGNGKTTFLSSVLDRWYEDGKRVYVLPLETQPKVFRTYWACQRRGIAPGLMLSGEYHQRPDALDLRDAVAAEVRMQIERPMRDRVRVKGVPAINETRLRVAVAEASDWGADVVIVDHIDHIAGGNGSNPYAESVKVNRAVLDLAQEHEIILLCATQLNNAAMSGSGDHLAQYGPPRPNHVFMGSHKRQVATGMIGLHRKLRDLGFNETPKTYKAAIQAARRGETEPMTVLEPDVMGVTAMKLRNFGARENQRAYLGVQHGRVVPIPKRDFL
jgi:KaiC/GvpD/RAD55 family RecA-like ATPase